MTKELAISIICGDVLGTSEQTYEAVKMAVKALSSAQPYLDNLHPKKDPNFSSCSHCVHSEDSEEICILRKCVHAIAELKECYKEGRQDDRP